MKQNLTKYFALGLFLTVGSAAAGLLSAPTASAWRPITFPIIGGAYYSNDYEAPRSNGKHHATDIFANKGQKIVSPVNGTLKYVPYPEPPYGYAIFIEDKDGYEYSLLHLNDDNPGTDDGNGGGFHAYAPDVRTGYKVVKGQLLGYVGDSGNAEGTPSHLHFEMYKPNGDPINPYHSLNIAQRIPRPAQYPALPMETLPYGKAFSGGANLSIGNFDDDPEPEYVTGAGPGGGPHVKLLDDDGTLINEFHAYNRAFNGGVDVATGDVDGDGTDEVITGAGPGGGPHVRVFDTTGVILGSFFAYDRAFNGGVHVASGDVDDDGTAEIITGAGPGGGPHVRVFALDSTVLDELFAYDRAFRGGVDVAAGDLDGDGTAEIITGAGPGGGPHVRTFQLGGGEVTGFYAYNRGFRGGVRVSAGNVRLGTPTVEILTSPASIGGPHLRMFDSASEVIDETKFLEPWWRGGYDIAAGPGMNLASAGGDRRTTVRTGIE